MVYNVLLPLSVPSCGSTVSLVVVISTFLKPLSEIRSVT